MNPKRIFLCTYYLSGINTGICGLLDTPLSAISVLLDKVSALLTPPNQFSLLVCIITKQSVFETQTVMLMLYNIIWVLTLVNLKIRVSHFQCIFFHKCKQTTCKEMPLMIHEYSWNPSSSFEHTVCSTVIFKYEENWSIIGSMEPQPPESESNISKDTNVVTYVV